MSGGERVTVLKTLLRQQLLAVPGIGVIDLERPDHDSTPRARPRNNAVTTPYWALTVTRGREQPASFGGGSTTRPVFRWYAVRLEGWRGFAAANTVTEEWDALVEAVENALRTCSPTLGASGLLAGFQDLEGIIADVDIVILGESGRAHHAVVTCEARFYLGLT